MYRMAMAGSNQLMAGAWRGANFDLISAKWKAIVLFVKVWQWIYKKLFNLQLLWT